jgi:hypothetical protein
VKKENFGGEGKNRYLSRREMEISMAEIARQLGIGTSAIGITMKKEEKKVN